MKQRKLIDKTYEEVTNTGWTEWVHPIHGHRDNNYRMVCCACGLTHEIQFRVVRQPSGRMDVKFRARRAR